jgi:prolipoprotein diacylglyceryl transferase
MSSLTSAVLIPASIPSPGQGVWHLGPVPIRAYALCILAGIFAGYWLGRRRWVARGGSAPVLADIMFWAIPFGLVGARIYHVITDAQQYFGPGEGSPIDALKIWQGGLGIWGAVGFGALGAWIACRRAKVPFLAVADAMAPGIALAQVFGRFGNYFNQELYGRVTDLPWALEIDTKDPEGKVVGQTLHHPTFLYEAIWNLGVMALILVLDRRFKFGHGRAFFLYVATYTAGRAWIEDLRIDTANHFLGLRLNVWTSIILFVLAVVAFVISAKRHPGQEAISTGPAAGQPTDSEKQGTEPGDAKPDDSEPSAAKADVDAEPEAGGAAPTETGTGDSSSASAEPAGGPAAEAPTAKANDGSRD